jgi:hypothetical protein
MKMNPRLLDSSQKVHFSALSSSIGSEGLIAPESFVNVSARTLRGIMVWNPPQAAACDPAVSVERTMWISLFKLLTDI